MFVPTFVIVILVIIFLEPLLNLACSLITLALGLAIIAIPVAFIGYVAMEVLQ